MTNFIYDLNQLVREAQEQKLNPVYIRILAKENLQTQILNFLYNNQKFQQLIFIGGSALRFCYDLPRLSEDLDFDVVSTINKKELAEEVKKFFNRILRYDKIEYIITGQFERITFKLPIIREIGITNQEGEKLFLKMEISQKENLKKYKTVAKPVRKGNVTFTARTFELPILMAGKISAVITRKYRKGKKNEINFKGRDYYDLWWYLSKRIQPDTDFVKDEIGIGDMKTIMSEIDEKVKSINPEFLEADLLALIPEPQFVKDFAKNYKDFYFRESEYLR